jgi:hypothetical protein
MGRTVSRRRPATEGAYGIKFTEVIVIALVLAGIGAGVMWYMNYRKSPSFALQNYFAAVKSGNVQAQYDLLDEDDKKNYMPTKHEYAQLFKQSQGYAERVVDVNIDASPAAPTTSEVTLNATVNILANSTGKELWQSGTSKGFTDKYVMRKAADGTWKLLLSKSGDGKGNLNLSNAGPTPPPQFGAE